jgi:RNA-directed DNA polymerase
MILERMAHELGLSVDFIERLARSASHEYKEYQIPKRGGGSRTIHHPSRRLKALQRWILLNVIEGLPVHESALAYRKSKSIMDNARPHAASRYLLRMDFENFFPSITAEDVANYIADRPPLFTGWSTRDTEAFSRIVCRKSHLTIGAPTSPGLSNALCHEMDSQLQAQSAKRGVVYTRYADDLFFSSQSANVLTKFEKDVAKIVRGLAIPAKLKLNSGKTRHSSKRGARRITGIVLGSDGRTHVGRELKRKIRALIFRLNSLDAQSRATLAGLIAYAVGLDPGFMNALIQKYGLGEVRNAARYTSTGT